MKIQSIILAALTVAVSTCVSAHNVNFMKKVTYDFNCPFPSEIMQKIQELSPSSTGIMFRPGEVYGLEHAVMQGMLYKERSAIYPYHMHVVLPHSIYRATAVVKLSSNGEPYPTAHCVYSTDIGHDIDLEVGMWGKNVKYTAGLLGAKQVHIDMLVPVH